MRTISRSQLLLTGTMILIILLGLLFFHSAISITYAVQPHPQRSSASSLPTNKGTFTCSTGTWNLLIGPTTVQNTYLNAVTALTAKNAWAVGESQSGSVTQTLIEHWNGTAWQIVPSPNVSPVTNDLDAVAAVSTNDIWAVGFYVLNGSLYTLIEHWDGTSWSIISSPNPGGYNVLQGLARVPGTNQLWAVGNYYDSPNNTIQHTLIEQWNGTNWTVIPSPNVGAYGNMLNGITAFSVNNVWAVGSYYINNGSSPEPLVEQWNGTNWKIVSSLNPTTNGSLSSATRVPFSQSLLAVGNSYSNPSGPFQALIERWDKGNWNIIPSPNPGSSVNTLTGVTALSSNNMWAVGYYANNGPYQPLVVHWDGTSWNAVSLPIPGTDNALLEGMTRIPGTNQLWAIGFYANNQGNAQMFAEFYC